MKIATVKSFNMVTVTPTLAAELLIRNTVNRKIRQSWVNLLAMILERGEWQTIQPGLAFDEQGRLRNGQHRLLAIIKSGIPAKMIMETGMTEDEAKAIDQGANRNVSDVTGLDKRIAEALRLAGRIFYGISPSIPQLETLGNAGLIATLERIIESCGTARRYYSSAAIRLAAAINIMNGADEEYVLTQYRSLILADYDKMTPVAQALCRQFQTKVTVSGDVSDMLARALKVFDPDLANIKKIQVNEGSTQQAKEFVREVLCKSMGIEYVPVNKRVPGRQLIDMSRNSARV